MQKTRIIIASDLSGFPLKKGIAAYLSEREDVEVLDYGIPSEDQPIPYFEQAVKAAKAIQQGIAGKGILICGTGQGMAIVANKHKGIYACVVNDVFSGERAKIINNANVITLGGWITAPYHAREIVAGWLQMSFAQKMEIKKDFLENAFNQVAEVEKKNFR
jgi:ribose 5-phosphate isomerase B